MNGPESGPGRSAQSAAPWLAVASAVQPVGRLLARLDWRAELASHLVEPALALSLAALATCMARPLRPRLGLGLALLVAGQALAPAIPLAPAAARPDPASTARLRILVANVLIDNLDRRPLIDLIRRERPDVVGLVEVDGRWLDGLDEVRREFAYRVEYPEGPSGQALWFRDRPDSVDREEPTDPSVWPVLHARLALGGRPLDLWLAHPPSPFDRARAGNPDLAGLAERVGSAVGARIVIGDLNSTDGSPHFGVLLARTGLRDSRGGFGRGTSWPVGSPCMIAIDHALVSPELAVVDRRLGPPIGSDHLPLILEVAPAARVATMAPGSSSTSGPGS